MFWTRSGSWGFVCGACVPWTGQSRWPEPLCDASSPSPKGCGTCDGACFTSRRRGARYAPGCTQADMHVLNCSACACVRVGMHARVHAPVCACSHSRVDALVHACGMHAVRCPYIHSYTHHTYIHSYIHEYMHTYIHSYIHEYMHTYIHSYIHTYIHTYIRTCIASGFDSLVLPNVYVSNKAAVALCRTIGFRLMCVIPRYSLPSNPNPNPKPKRNPNPKPKPRPKPKPKSETKPKPKPKPRPRPKFETRNLETSKT